MGRIEMSPGIYMSPLPVCLVTSGTADAPDVCTVAWTGVACSKPPRVYISLMPSRLTHQKIDENGEFVINLVSRSLVRAADFCGVRSGRDVDKFKEAHLTPVSSLAVAPPTIDESPLSIECRVFNRLELGSHDMFLADVVAATAREELFDESGKLRYGRADLASYSHGDYVELGRSLGGFGFSVRKSGNRH
ncbi:MAG: flavin reductase family protein [Oscillospiraceae bacterium]|jgi:flavin reductase (DIM6/NTAB) family NADH-FMN oxidoreductase RutF